MTTEDIIRKLTSRKFWLCAAAFLGSIAASIAGITTSNESVAIVGTVCGVISAAIYAAPRTRGDDPAISCKFVSRYGCSPHTRG